MHEQLEGHQLVQVHGGNQLFQFANGSLLQLVAYSKQDLTRGEVATHLVCFSDR